jgi:TatD DNase family protein
MEKRNRKIELFDGHTHLGEIGDPSGAIARAGKIGVFSIVTVGSDYESNKRALEISGRYERTVVYAALGIHPWNLKAEQLENTFRFIEENMGKAVAVGEIGLDYWIKRARKDPSERELQKEAFGRLLDLGKKTKKPAIVHCRGAWEDCLDLVMGAQIQKAIFHWFSGPIEVLAKVLGHGYFISATPAAAYSEKHQRAIARTPLENLLLETDSPVEYEGKAAEPADVCKTLEAVAKIKGAKREEVAEITTRNALVFFDLESRHPIGK